MFPEFFRWILEKIGFDDEAIDVLREIRRLLKVRNRDIDVFCWIYLSMILHILLGFLVWIDFPLWTWLLTTFIPTIIIYFITLKRDGIVK